MTERLSTVRCPDSGTSIIAPVIHGTSKCTYCFRHVTVEMRGPVKLDQHPVLASHLLPADHWDVPAAYEPDPSGTVWH